MEKDYQIRVIIVGGGVVGLVLANALEVENTDSLRHALSKANRLPASRH
jgi:2-polyprenyl-6-methoxyphenol hydroxylase-like FAD-dependent oxidoreductase